MTHKGWKGILPLGIQVSQVKNTWLVMDLVSPFCLLNNESFMHPVTACFLLLPHGCSVLVPLS